MSGNRYYFRITPQDTDNPPYLFIYKVGKTLEDSKYTAYHRYPKEQQRLEEWANKQKFPPHIFVNRFGYAAVDAGFLKDDEQLNQLLSRVGIKPRLTTQGKTMDWVDVATKDFASNAPEIEFKDGSYTKPELRERIKNRIMAGSKGGAPGQWSARKAQLLAMEYRKAGGGYRGKPRKTQRSLKKWTREKWTTSDGKPAIRKGGTRRYLPAAAWKRLTPAQRAATNRKKVSGSKQGHQFVANTEAAERAGRNIRKR